MPLIHNFSFLQDTTLITSLSQVYLRHHALPLVFLPNPGRLGEGLQTWQLDRQLGTKHVY